MSLSNYREIGGPSGHLARCEPFRGNSMSAVIDADGTYRVFSYATEIASVEEPDHEHGLVKNVLPENRWGATTGRHLNLCRVWLPGLDPEQREQLI